MSNKKNLILDLVIFLVFLAVANPSLTGNSIHEWLSVAFAAALITHLLFHWRWIVGVTKKFFKKLFHQSRLNFVINLLFFIAITICILSGLLISKNVMSTLGFQLNVGREWKSIHVLSADLSVILLAFHLGLHLNWILYLIKRYLILPVGKLFRRPARES